jgi:superfamily I DNA and RNA helicase
MIPSLEGNSKETLAFEILQSEMRDMRHMFEIMMMERKKAPSRDSIAAIEYERISNELDKIKTNRIPMEERHRALEILMRDAEELMMNSNRESDHRHYRMLMERVHRTMKEFA